MALSFHLIPPWMASSSSVQIVSSSASWGNLVTGFGIHPSLVWSCHSIFTSSKTLFGNQVPFTDLVGRAVDTFAGYHVGGSISLSLCAGKGF